MVNSKAFSVQLSQELFDKYFDVDFTCEEYIAAAQRDDNNYLQMAEQVENNLFNLTDAEYDEILEAQVVTPQEQ